ncbi:MAG: hypothetical protein VX731_02925 [Candidatus Neomarinimicrobiota bacterium]|nr:hypothetical protein [Candidatus Neomarinimicrobiota bacterium]
MFLKTPYEIQKKSNIKITTARYYIPSGRFIQKRDYIDEKFLLNKSIEDSLFKTKGGRIVYSNGGITPDSTVQEQKMDIITTQFWRSGYFYSFAQENKYLYEKFSDVEKDGALLDKFYSYAKNRKKATLPGQKELLELEENILSIDSTNIDVRKAINTLSDFYDKKITQKSTAESEQMHQILLLEFAGLFNGPKGRIEQSFLNDAVLKTAIDIMHNQNFYANTLTNTQVIEN